MTILEAYPETDEYECACECGAIDCLTVEEIQEARPCLACGRPMIQGEHEHGN